MTSPEDSNLGQRWWTANPNIPTQRRGAVGFLRVHAEEDVKQTRGCPYPCEWFADRKCMWVYG